MYEQYAAKKKLVTKISWRPDTTMICGEHCGFIVFQGMVQYTIVKRTRDNMLQTRINYELGSMYGMYMCICVCAYMFWKALYHHAQPEIR